MIKQIIKIFSIFALIAIVSGCGVRNDLDKPNKAFPRVYPVK